MYQTDEQLEGKENMVERIWILFWEEQYEYPYGGQQILGVFASREDAEAARDERAGRRTEFIEEMEVGKLYGFGDITS